MTSEQKPSKRLNIILWIAQVLLAIVFIGAGCMKIIKPEALPFPWIKDNASLVLIAGIVDLLAGIGIVFPALLHIQPKLTIYTAYGIVLLMIVAGIFHISRAEGNDIGFNIFMALLALFIAWGRQTKAPIS